MKKLFAGLYSAILAAYSLFAADREVYFYRMSSLTSDGNKPGCYMTFTDQEGLRGRGGSTIGRSSGVPCTIFRNGEAIGTMYTDRVRNEFTDYDVVPGETYTYEIRGYDGAYSATTGERNITCNFIYGINLETLVVTFESDNNTAKAVTYSLYKQTVNGKESISKKVSCTTSDDWINVESGTGVINVWVDPNDTGVMRIGTFTIEYEGFKSLIKVIQGKSESLVVVTISDNAVISIPQSYFLDNCATSLIANGGDCNAAALADAANGMKVWECFVAGLDPTNENSRFVSKIEVENGFPIIRWSPNLNTNGVVRKYTILGKDSLTDTVDWAPTNSTHRFFKVKVEMP